MSISINPIFPVIAAQGAAPDLVLKPGTVIDAEVLKLLSDDLVRIAISGLSIEVLSEIPLQVGQALQLAVSQTPDGIRLAVVGPAVGATATASADAVTLAPDIVDVATSTPVGAALAINQPSRNELTPVERAAVAAAAESAATQQESLAPLFANLDAVAASNALPPNLRQAVMQVLAQRTSLDQNLSGSDVKNGLQKSGLFLEASLASGAVLSPAGIPDLKAALIVLRQTLLSSLGATRAAESPAASATAAQQPVLPGLPAFPAWMPRRGRSCRSRSRRRLLRRRQLKQQLRRILRRHQRLPRPLPKSTCWKFFCRRRACRLRMTLWNWAARSVLCSLKGLIIPGPERRQPAPPLPCCRRCCRKVRRKSVTLLRQRHH
jgi:hypothetical protein